MRKNISDHKLYREARREQFGVSLCRYHRCREEGHRVSYARQRGMGFVALNEYFSGSIGHHVNDFDVVYIPREVHQLYTFGRCGKTHRELVMNYYGNIENMRNNVSASKNLVTHGIMVMKDKDGL